MKRLFLLFLLFTSLPLFAESPHKWWSTTVETALVKANNNRSQLEKVLHAVPAEQRSGLEFLIINMPDSDLNSLTAEFLLTNHSLAYKARRDAPWGKLTPDDIFYNNVLPYANIDEKRDPWRQELYDLCQPLIKDCKTPSEVTQKLNRELFPLLKVKYAPQRRAPNFSPKESIAQGTASCTGLSILLSDACRAVGVPTRIVGTPNWFDKRGNHTWLEIWDGKWRFTGACEPDPNGLDRGWFVGDAAKAQKDSPEHAIYAASFRKTNQHFPLVWARSNKAIPGENITERYAVASKPAETARLSVRVVDANQKRVVRAVMVSDGTRTWEGQSRGESADLNDFVHFDLPPKTAVTVRIGDVTKSITTGKAGESQLIEVTASMLASVDVPRELKLALAHDHRSFAKLTEMEFAKIPLTKSDAAIARQYLWAAHIEQIRAERVKEIADRVIKDGQHELKFDWTIFGEKPKTGRSLWISLHGGGGAPARVNDQQWQNQKRLYKLDEGIYLSPRGPTNTWNLWHEPHIDRLFARLIEDLIVLEDVNPDRVYVLGYSAGGDGVYQIGPRMADHWAAAAMMAGHPNGVSLLSLRNTPFALQVGGKDAAYNRNAVGKEYGEQLATLRANDPKGYEHFVKIYDGKGHWMDGEDKIALPWMAKFTRNAVPDRVVWKQTGTPRDRLYWLAVPTTNAKLDSLVIAERKGQAIDISRVENVTKLLVRMDDRMLDLDSSVVVTAQGRELYRGRPSRTVQTMLNCLTGRGDPKLIFDAEVSVELSQPAPKLPE